MNQRLEQLRRAFIIAVALFVGSMAAITAFTVARLRTDSIAAGLEVSALHSRSFEDLITHNLHVIGLIAAHALSGALDQPEPGGGSSRFSSTLARAPYLRSMSFVNANGRIVSSSNPANVDLTIETARFLPLVAAEQELLRVGLPWVGRDFVSGRPAQGAPVESTAPTFIPVTQTVRLGDRVLTVLFALNPDYFLNLFSRKVGEHEGVVRVLRYDGVLLMSTDPNEHPGDVQQSLMRQMRLEEVESGNIERSLAERPVLTAFRASRAYPVAVVTDIDREVALRNWEIQTRALLTVVSTVLVAIVALSFAYYRRQKQAILERIEAERLQRINATVFDSSSEAIVIADPRAVVISVNAAFTRVAGYADEEIVGRHLPDLFDEAGQASFAEMVERVDAHLLSNVSAHGMTADARLRCKDGRWIWTEILSTPQFNARGKLTGYNRICRDISERRQMEEQVRQLAFFDPLTQLANRRLLLDRLTTAIAVCRRNTSFGALMFLDLDNFKPLNDTYGHDVGDLLLIETANRLRACVRESDSVGRFGGDEFVVILSALAHDQDLSFRQSALVAEKIRLRLASPFVIGAESGAVPGKCVEHRCSSSIGMTLFSGDDTTENALRRADEAMYRAKEAGGNTVRHFDQAVHEQRAGEPSPVLAETLGPE